MVAETLLWVNNRELSSKSGYFHAAPNLQAPGASNFIAELVLSGSPAHLFALKRQEWQWRDKYLNSGRLKCSFD